ncbi:MAG: hypothetical protein GXY40_06355 [Syntrophomonadaceae bacterium]|nr:hypothetical protein [Syntrophomonadaceae bacterium]
MLFKKISKTPVAILTTLVFILSLVFSIPLLAAEDDAFTINFTTTKLSPQDTVIQMDLSKGIDRQLENDLAKIHVSDKSSGQNITYSDYKYSKEGQQAEKVRRLELFFNNLNPDTTYVIELDADFTANNDSTLGAKQSFEFTTTAQEEQPTEPVTPDPEEPVVEPEEPVTPEPEQPVDPQPEQPVNPNPEQPVDPQPEQPVNPEPDQSELTPKVELKDISGHWAQAIIMELVNSGVVSGYPDATFQPDKNITRAEFTTALVKAFELENKTGKDFADITNHWAKDAIVTAASHGIVNGYDANSFGPDNNITREQMAVMIVKAAQLNKNDGESKQFIDNDKICSWAAEAIAIASQHNIITGYPDNSFKPQGEATRAEAATVIIKILQAIS